MSEEADKKISIWEQILYAITKARKLLDLCELSNKRFIGYVVFLSFLISLVTVVVPTTATIASFYGFKTLFGETLPRFELVDGEIRTEQEKDVKLYIAGMNVVFNTSQDVCPKEELTASGIYMTFGKKNVQMFIATGSEQIDFYNIEASLLFPDGLNNDMLVQMVPYLYVCFIITYFFMIIGLVVKYLALAIIYSVFANAMIQKNAYPLSYGNAFKMAYYAQTLGVLISNVNVALGYFIPSFIATFVGVLITVFKINSAFKISDDKNS